MALVLSFNITYMRMNSCRKIGIKPKRPLELLLLLSGAQILQAMLLSLPVLIGCEMATP